MAQIRVTKGEAVGSEFRFDEQAVIGRGSAADISLTDPGISRRHARIVCTDEGWVLSDLQSANGTFVRGRRVLEPLLLRNGDRFAVASVELELVADEARRPELRYTDGDQQPVLGSVLAAKATDLLFAGNATDDAGLAALRHRLQLMYEVGEALTSILDEAELLRTILQKIFTVFPGIERGSILVLDEATQQLLPRVSTTREGEEIDLAVSRTMVWDSIDNRRAILSVDAAHDERFAAAQTVQSLALHAVACVPMLFRDEVFGVIHLDGPDPQRAIPAADLPLLMGIGAQAGMGIAHARFHARALHQELVSQDLAMARRIQARFLPTEPPDVERWEFWGDSKAALEVGGDYYDYLSFADGRIGVAVGDVSGKGVSGALYMARLSSEIRYQTAMSRDVREVVAKVNQTLSKELEAGMFVTLLMAAIDPRSGEVQIVSAGHNPPLLRHSGGEVEPLAIPRNVPLGVDDERVFEDIRYVLLAGEMVIFYTDGITESMDVNQEEFGEQRLIKAIAAAGASASSVGRAVVAAAETFAGDAPQNDDLTFVCFGPVKSGHRSIDTTDRMRPVNL